MEKYVKVNGRKNFVYGYGQGSIALVLLSGSGVPFPSLEYKTLAQSLGETYQVVGIEKLGYGHSDMAEDGRYLDDVVQEYRSVLRELGINMPVVLAAHSMGVIEALHWGRQYPAEVAAILMVEKNNPYLQVPMLFFLSNGDGTTYEKDKWIQYSLQYLDHIKIAEYQLFDHPHDLYQFVYQEIAQFSKAFISRYIG